MYSLKVHLKFYLIILSFFIGSFQPFFSQQQEFSQEIKTKILNYISQQEAEKNNLTPNEIRVESGLRKLLNTMETDHINGTLSNKISENKYSSSSFRVNKQSEIHILITLLNGKDNDSIIIKNEIFNLGGHIQSIVKPTITMPVEIYCYVPYNQIINLAKNTSIGNISAIGSPVIRMGDKLTAGDWQLNVDKARQYFNKKGLGIKVGVISDGVDGISNSITSGDLPTSINNPNHILNAGSGNEGTAILEIIYDLAPEADLYFAGLNSDDGPNGMANRINQLRSAGCKIIIDDIGWPYDSPQFSEDNLYNTIYSYVNSYHGTYVSAAGNDGASCWYGTFYPNVDMMNLWYRNGATYYYQNGFDATDGEKIDVIIQWADKWNYARTDYDLYLFDALGNAVETGQGRNAQGTNGSIPRENIVFTFEAGTYLPPFNVVVKLSNNTPAGEPNKELRLIINRNETLDYTYQNFLSYPLRPNNQIFGKEMIATLSVGAYPSSNMNILENFSSRGPSKLFSFDDNGVQTGVIPHNTPAIVATDGVETNAEGFSIFEGTSASAPHIAGIAAIYYSKFPAGNFYEAMTKSAISIAGGTGGIYNDQSGFGRADAKECLIYSLTSISPGTITANTNWLDYNVNGTVTINSNVEVTIPNGSTCVVTGSVNFVNSNSKIIINEGGALIVRQGAIVDQTHVTGNIIYENSITVTQLAENSGLLANSNVYRWEEIPNNHFQEYPVPKNFIDFIIGSPTVFKANQEVISDQKYSFWSIDNVRTPSIINHQSFTIDKIPSTYAAQFKSIHNATIKNFVEGISVNSGVFYFRDPWLIDDADEKGPKNRGLNPNWNQLNFSTNPNITTGSVFKGVLIGENPAFDPTKAIYKLWAGSQQLNLGGIFGVRNCYFQNWSATGANLQPYGDGKETWAVFTSEGANVYANYKSLQLTNNSNAYSFNGQTKFLKTEEGHLHNVYESMNTVWYERSTDGGTTWEIMNGGMPLTYNVGGANAKSPAISCSNDGSLPFIYITYQIDNYGGYEEDYVLLSQFFNGVHRWTEFVSDILPSYSYDTRPVVTGLNQFAMVVFKSASNAPFTAVEFKVNASGNLIQIIPRNFPAAYVNSSCGSPSITNGEGKYHLAYQWGVFSIGYLRWSVYTDPSSFNYYSTPSNGSGYNLNMDPSISLANFNPVVSWKGSLYAGSPQAVLRRGTLSGSNMIWSDFLKVGNNINYVHSNSASNSTEKTVMTWSQDGSTTKWVRRTYPVNGKTEYSSPQGLNPSGINSQVSSGTDYNNMKANIFRSSSPLYYFTQSTTDFSVLQEEAGELNKISVDDTIVTFGRSGVADINGIEFVFNIGDILTGDSIIQFIDKPDTIVYASSNELNEFTRTNNFTLNPETNFYFSNIYYVVQKSDPDTAMSTNDAVNFKVELVNAITDQVVGSFDNITYNKTNLEKYANIDYEVDCSGIIPGDYYLRLVTNVNGNANYALANIISDNTTLAKKNFNKVNFTGSEIPITYELSNNFPNPFNPSTTIRYQIPQDGIVTLKIYDILGSEVATLVNEEKLAGKYEVNFNASSLASGVYIYKIQAGSFVNSKKMILLK